MRRPWKSSPTASRCGSVCSFEVLFTSDAKPLTSEIYSLAVVFTGTQTIGLCEDFDMLCSVLPLLAQSGSVLSVLARSGSVLSVLARCCPFRLGAVRSGLVRLSAIQPGISAYVSQRFVRHNVMFMNYYWVFVLVPALSHLLQSTETRGEPLCVCLCVTAGACDCVCV